MTAVVMTDLVKHSTFGKYLSIVALSARQRLQERAALWGRILFYFLILLIFSRLWQALLSGEGAAARPASYVWYLAVTEWIMISQPALWLDIETDVRNGDVAYHLARPVSYVGIKLAEAAGDLWLRQAVLGAAGLAFARVLAGEWPSGQGLLLAVLVASVASVVLLLAYAAVGLCAFWIHDCTSLYIIWQKLGFVLGGLMLPLDIYPGWLRTIALHSPFSALLYGPARLVMQPDPALALQVLLSMLGWGACVVCVVLALEWRGRRTLTLHGG